MLVTYARPPLHWRGYQETYGKMPFFLPVIVPFVDIQVSLFPKKYVYLQIGCDAVLNRMYLVITCIVM